MNNNNCRYNIDELIEEMDVSLEEVKELYKSYFWEMKENTEDISKYLKACEYTKVERILHNIKGVSINLNIIDVYNEAAIFNEVIKKRVEEDYDNYLKKLIKLVNEAESEVQKFFNEKEKLEG